MSHTSELTSLDVLRPLMQRGTTIPARMSWDSWKAHEDMRAEKVALYRKYADGEHEVALSDEMKTALRLQGDDVFALNHCDNIIQTLADRLKVAKLRATVSTEAGDVDTATSEGANQWIEKLLLNNRFDGLQLDVHSDTPRDGVDYILVEYDTARDRVVWHHEPGFDGHSGMIAVWGDDGLTPTLCIKIWHEIQTGADSKLIDHIRINLYFPDRVEKYIAVDGTLAPFTDDGGVSVFPWLMRDKQPLGVAVIPFVYKRRQYDRHGLGRLDDVIPVQRATNRMLVSLIGIAENLGFPIRYLFGGEVPTAVRPGTWIQVKLPDKKTLPGGQEVPLTPDERASLMAQITNIKIGQLQSAGLESMLAQLLTLIMQMYIISGTPYPEGPGANISGEALKQLDIRLVGTAQRCQVSFGNSWEDLIRLSARVEATFGAGEPFPEDAMLQAEWESAEVRDDGAVIDNVAKTADIIGSLDVRTKVEMLAPVHGWDKTRIDEIVQRIEDSQLASLERELGLSNADTSREFGNGVALEDPLNGNGNGANTTPPTDAPLRVPTEAL